MLANRLSEGAGSRVLVLEGGGSDRSVLIQMPAALGIPLFMPRFNWGFESDPEPGLDGRRMESCGFIRSRAGLRWPDIQYHFMPAVYVPSNETPQALRRPAGFVQFPGPGYQVHVGPNKPKSRGRVNILSPDPRAKPSIRFNYLQHEQDRTDWRAAVRLTREIMNQPALDLYRGDEVAPGEAVRSDEEIDAWVRSAGETVYHPSSSCKMGAPTDPMAVVDPQCRVIGVEGLRVVDSSASSRRRAGSSSPTPPTSMTAPVRRCASWSRRT